MAVATLNKKPEEKKKLTNQDKIQILNTLHFLDEIILGTVLDKVNTENKIPYETLKNFYLTTSNSIEMMSNEGKKDRAPKAILDNIAKVEKGETHFDGEFVLNLKNIKDESKVGSIKVKKVVDFTEYSVSSTYDFDEFQNNEYSKIIFDSLRTEYKSLEGKELSEIVNYFVNNLQQMSLRAAQLEGKPN